MFIRFQSLRNNAYLRLFSGYSGPQRSQVVFIEKDPDCDVMFVLPDPVPSDELTPEQLEAVAGGCFDIEIGDIHICWETA